MATKKTGPPPAGWEPKNATAYCDHHDRYMNDTYIHRRRCLLRGNAKRAACKHFHWIGNHDEREKGG